MTVIAWDGKTLAADKQATGNGMPRTVTKLHRVPGGVIGITGKWLRAQHIIAWFKKGADPAEYPGPRPMDPNEQVDVLFATTDGELYFYEDTPEGELINEPFMAMGSGRDYAMATMECGHDAVRAVEVASKFDIWCGMGVDYMSPLLDVNDSAAFPFP